MNQPVLPLISNPHDLLMGGHDDALRAELDAAFYKVADFLRNADAT